MALEHAIEAQVLNTSGGAIGNFIIAFQIIPKLFNYHLNEASDSKRFLLTRSEVNLDKLAYEDRHFREVFNVIFISSTINITNLSRKKQCAEGRSFINLHAIYILHARRGARLMRRLPKTS